jgi:hypothetical protein
MEEFRRRNKHSWPPLFEMPEHWREPIAREAQLAGFEEPSASALERRFLQFIAEIEGAQVRPQYEYRFLSLNISISGAHVGVLTEEGRAELDRWVGDGWRCLSVYPRPGFVDQLLAIMERATADMHQPLLSFRLRTEMRPGQPRFLVAEVRNVAVNTVATDVRVYVGGVGHMRRVPMLVAGDPAVELRESLDDKLAYDTYLKNVRHVILEFADRFGQYYKQVGDLVQTAAEQDTYTLTVDGVGRPEPLDTSRLLPESIHPRQPSS